MTITWLVASMLSGLSGDAPAEGALSAGGCSGQTFVVAGGRPAERAPAFTEELDARQASIGTIKTDIRNPGAPPRAERPFRMSTLNDAHPPKKIGFRAV
jgi:hypothetical protein